MRKIISGTCATLLLVACTDKVHNADYYAAHIDEAKTVLEKCQRGEVVGENCENARTAAGRYMIGKFSDSLKERLKTGQQD
jgi:hypothetical protein